MTPAERVERLVRSGAVDSEEGKRLLAALHAEPAPSPIHLLLHPFERIGGGHAAVLGLFVSVISIAVARTGVRFDGLLDLHITTRPVTTAIALADQVVDWPLAAIFFYAYARIFSPHVRLLDFLGATGFARIPLLIAAPPLRMVAPLLDIRDPLRMPGALLIIVAVSLVGIVLNIALLYQGFKNASGLTGSKLVAGFIALVIGVEIASKLALAVLT